MVRRGIGTTRHGVHWFEFAMKIQTVLLNLFRTMDNWSYNAIFAIPICLHRKRTDTIGLFFFYKDDLAFFYREVNLSNKIICRL
jgi:hypothetical protein